MTELTFERVDNLEAAMVAMCTLLLAYIEADLAQTWQPSAKALAEKLREILDQLG